MNCGECLMHRVEVVELPASGKCPKCGAEYGAQKEKQRDGTHDPLGDERAAKPTPADAYRADPHKFTHGRCHTCQKKGNPAVVFAWRTGKRRRLCDGPGCPNCGNVLVRTTTTLIHSVTIQVREPIFNPAEAARMRGKQ